MRDGLNRRDFLRMAGTGAALAVLPRALLADLPDAGGARPNFVLVMADDMGWGDLAANGSNAFVKTPHLDAMAAAGVRFSRFYAASPLCSPTRAAFLSGRYPSRYACFVPGESLPAGEVTIAESLRAAGYATGHFGKWHVGSMNAKEPDSPPGQGFQTSFSIANSYMVHKMDVRFLRQGKPEQSQGYCEDVIMGEALKFIRASVAEKRPFLAVVWNMAVHDPFESPERLRALYADRPEKERPYWGMVSAIDENIGRLRRTLRELRVADNTLVLYTSDNGAVGPSRAHMPFSGGKHNIWEGGLRVPGVVEWPARIARPFASDVPVYTCDLFPTVLAAAGVAIPLNFRPLDGMNILPVLDGRMRERPKPIVFHFDDFKRKARKGPFGSNGFAVVDGRFKWMTDLQGAGGRLFDVLTDPAEKTDTAAERKDVAARLEAVRAKWWTEVQAEPAFRPADAPSPSRGTKKPATQ